MSKRFFEAMARGIKNSTIGIDGVARTLLIQNVCHELGTLGPFDADKFTAACTPIDAIPNPERLGALEVGDTFGHPTVLGHWQVLEQSDQFASACLCERTGQRERQWFDTDDMVNHLGGRKSHGLDK